MYEGATCLAGFEPILSSWQDCKLAAVALNITGDSIGHVDYHTQKGSEAFGTDVPQGCFRDAVTNRVYFNPGKGGSGRKKNDQNKWSDRVVCRQTNAGMRERVRVDVYVIAHRIFLGTGQHKTLTHALHTYMHTHSRT